MFGMLHNQSFTYDSSLPASINDPPLWPYTLDFPIPHSCAIPPCPKRSFPGLWEIGEFNNPTVGLKIQINGILK